MGHLLSCQENLVHLDRMIKERKREMCVRQSKNKKIKAAFTGEREIKIKLKIYVRRTDYVCEI